MAETRARDTADINVTVDALPTFDEAAALTNRNLLYNGAMQVAQRSASVTGITTSGYYTADRFRATVETLGTWTQTVENDAPTGSGFTKSLKMLCTTADAAPAGVDRLFLSQIIEGQDLQRVAKGTASAQQLTLSFWVKTNVTGTYIAELFDLDNTRQVSAAYTVSSSATWEKKVITFPADTTGAFDNDSNGSLFVDFYLAIGSNNSSGTLNTVWAANNPVNRAAGQTNLAAATDNYWQVTGVQLEVGPVATAFEFKSYGQELAECQRYYYRTQPGASVRLLAISGTCVATTTAVVNTPFPVTMRTRPTALEQIGTANNYGLLKSDGSRVACSSVPAFEAYTTENAATTLATVSSGLTAGHSTAITTEASGAFLAWSAEL